METSASLLLPGNTICSSSSDLQLLAPSPCPYKIRCPGLLDSHKAACRLLLSTGAGHCSLTASSLGWRGRNESSTLLQQQGNSPRDKNEGRKVLQTLNDISALNCQETRGYVVWKY